MQQHSNRIQANTRSERVVEVVSTLGDSVIDVTHVSLAPEQASRRSAYLMLGAAALFAVVAAGAFATGVVTAAANERAELAWMQDATRQAHDYRPQRLSPVYDWAAFGGLAGALLAFGFGMARLRTTGRRNGLTIGTDRDADICTAQATAALSPLVSRRDGRAVVTVSPGMRAELRAHGHSRDLAELSALGLAKASPDSTESWDLSVPEVGILNLHVGPLRIAIREVTMAPSRLNSLVARFDERFAQFFGMSAVAHLAVLALFYTLPPSAYSLTMDADGSEARDRNIRLKASEASKQHTQPDHHTHNTPKAPNTTGGDKQPIARNPETRPMAPGPGDAGNPRPRTRSEAISSVTQVGPVAVLMNTSASLRMFDAGPMIAMNDHALTSLILDDNGPGGPGFGGPNVGFNDIPGTVKSGNYKTIGDPNGDPNARPGGRNPGPALRDRPSGERAPRVTIKNPIIHGDLDKSIIRRYIKHKLARIQYCYERELTVTPHLAGTVTTEFMINSQGQVVYAHASGSGSKRLDSCIAGVVKSVKFPKPSDRASVKVTYPFHFRRAG